MNKAHMRWELGLMLLPVLILGGWGWQQSQHSRPKTYAAHNQLVVQSITREAATPRERALGCDTHLTIVIGHRGPTLKAWGQQTMTASLGWQCEDEQLVYKIGKKVSTLDDKRVQWMDTRYDAARDVYITTFAFALAQVPASYGQLTFQTVLGCVPAPLSSPNPKPDKVPIAFVVRRAGEHITAVALRKYCPLELINTQLQRWNVKTGIVAYMVFTLKSYEPIRKGDEAFIRIDKAYLEANNGHRYTSRTSYSVQVDAARQQILLTKEIEPSELPPRASRVTLHLDVVLRDYWPLKLTAVVCDRKTPTPALAHPKIGIWKAS